MKKTSNILNSGNDPSYINSIFNKVLSDGNDLRRAEIEIPVICTDVITGASHKEISVQDGYHFNEDGVDKVFFISSYDYFEYHQVNLESPEITVKIGDAVNQEAYDIELSRKKRNEGQAIEYVKEKLPIEMLVDKGAKPSLVKQLAYSLANNLHEKFDTPRKLHIPDKLDTQAGVAQVVLELRKLLGNLKKQSDFANEHNVKPFYQASFLNIASEAHKVFNRDVMSNIARSHANGVLYAVEKTAMDEVTISVKSLDGRVSGSLSYKASDQLETTFFHTPEGDGMMEARVFSIPSVSSMTAKGAVSDNFRELVEAMRKGTNVVEFKSIGEVPLSPDDFKHSVKIHTDSLKKMGVSSLVIDNAHPDVASVRATMLISEQHPTLVSNKMLPDELPKPKLPQPSDLEQTPSY